jgi:nucleoside-diphosphate-sugar epimerase
MALAFVAGASGFIGNRFVADLRRAGHDVTALVRREADAARLRGSGVRAVVGDLLVRGAWQREVEKAAWIAQLAQPAAFGVRVSRRRASKYRDARLRMDENLLSAAKSAERVLYVAGTSYYGNLGPERRDESAEPRPSGWGPYLAPAIESLGQRARAGLPVVAAFPGYVYGNGSWFEEYVLEPVERGRVIHTIAGPSHFASFVHVDDCARALVHLLDRGVIGERYFVVDDAPSTWVDFYGQAPRAMGVPYRLRKIPVSLMRIGVGEIITESLLGDAVLSNAKLRATGFTLEYPTCAAGIASIVRARGRHARERG